MAEADRVPGKGWYVLAGVLALAGVVAMGALIAWFVVTLDRGAQFLVPGQLSVELDRPGKYLVWNDHRTVFQGRSYDTPEKRPAGARVSVINPAGGPPPAVSASHGSTTNIGDARSVALYRFNIERPGRYEIQVEGNFTPRVFSVSRDFLPALLWMIFGSIALLFGGLGLATAVAAWAFIRRERGAPDVPAGTVAAVASDREKSLKLIAAIVYGLQLASFLVGITFIAAVIIGYIKRRDAEGTWLESHFRWQIRTFWYSLLWCGIGLATAIILVGFLVLAAAAVWLLYRAIKGWVALEEGRPMYA